MSYTPEDEKRLYEAYITLKPHLNPPVVEIEEKNVIDARYSTYYDSIANFIIIGYTTVLALSLLIGM